MKTILVLAVLIVFTPMIFSCAENENASDDNNDETNDDDSAADDDSANDDDDQSNADLSDHPTYPETNLEFVGVNYFYRESPVYPWDDGFYDANFYHYAKQKWQLKYQISADNTDFIKQIWGPSPNEVFAIGSTKGLFMSTPLILFYHDGEWEDISLFFPSTEIVGVGGTSSDNVYFVANVDKNIDPDITDLDHYIIYHYDGQNIEKILVGESGKILKGLWVDESGEVFMAGNQWSPKSGENILLLHYYQNIWNEIILNNDNKCIITKIWGLPQNNIYIGGYKKTNRNWDPCIMYYNGNDIYNLNIPDMSELSGMAVEVKKIFATEDDVYFALSSQEVLIKIYLYNGGEFIDINFPLHLDDYTYGLEDMWVSPGGDVYVVGPYKGVMHYDGETWKRIPGPWLWKIYGFADQGTAGDMIGEE